MGNTKRNLVVIYEPVYMITRNYTDKDGYNLKDNIQFCTTEEEARNIMEYLDNKPITNESSLEFSNDDNAEEVYHIEKIYGKKPHFTHLSIEEYAMCNMSDIFIAENQLSVDDLMRIIDDRDIELLVTLDFDYAHICNGDMFSSVKGKLNTKWDGKDKKDKWFFMSKYPLIKSQPDKMHYYPVGSEGRKVIGWRFKI